MNKYISTLAAILLILQTTVFSQPSQKIFDESLSTEERVWYLINQLSLEEKVKQMMFNAPAIERLDIPAYNWWNEALHGVARSGTATVFPQAIGLAATFDTNLAYRTAEAISDEARAMYNAAVANDNYSRYAGLTFWTPNINIFRDPRWGRGQETYGEDPFLTGLMGLNFVKGLQGNHPKYLKVAACAKHFAVHSGPEKLRHEFNATVSNKDLYETYLPAFETLVKGGVESVMCAYNRTNDEPCCGNKLLLVDILRNKWNFKGHVVSDCWALVDFHVGHKFTKNAVESAAVALKRGVNLNCGEVYYPNLTKAVEIGLITENEINQSLATLLRTRFKLGMFDAPESNPYNKIPVSVIGCFEHTQLALESARKSLVLLKNNGVLPLKKNLKSIFLTGPTATSIEALSGNYYGVSKNMVTIQEGLANRMDAGVLMQYKPGFLLSQNNKNPFDWTTGDAKDADVCIVTMGLTGNLEGEEGESIESNHFGDRLDYNLPQNQINFLKKLRENNSKPIIVVLTGGSPVNMKEISELADAIIWVWYPGEQGGNAIADVIFGNVSPSGRLPVTFPKSFEQLPAYEDYNMKGRTYRFMSEEPFYPFGFGLSYSNFVYSAIRLSKKSISLKDSAQVEITVTNAGKMAADEVVQLYISHSGKQIDVPFYSLKDFQRIKLDVNQSKKLVFSLNPKMFETFDAEGAKKMQHGIATIYIGGSLPIQRSLDLGMTKWQETVLKIQ